jgi:23S rRNA pseudouridine1911/1915/1917 synthase
MQRLEVRNQRSEVRLDVYLAESNIGLTRSQAKQLIEKGFVQVEGKKAKASLHLEEGDVVQVTIPPPAVYEVEAEDIPLDVIYEDKDIIVINKQVGMVVHPAVGNFSGTLVNALLGHCKDLSGIGGEIKPGIVHRLDKGTSGIMVAAKNDQAHQSLSKQFKDRTVTKIYGALVYGAPKTETGVIDKPIGRSMKDRKRMSTRTSKGRIAHTEWKVLERFDKYLAWLEVNLGTGRTHQIRVHLSGMGHPLVGDDTYGRGGPNRVKEGNLRKLVAVFERPALHAWKLGFDHPQTGERMNFDAPLPEDLKELLEQLRGI